MMTKISHSRCIPCPTLESFIKNVEAIQNMGYRRFSGEPKTDQWAIKELRHNKEKTLLVIRGSDGKLAVDNNKFIDEYEITSIIELENEKYF